MFAFLQQPLIYISWVSNISHWQIEYIQLVWACGLRASAHGFIWTTVVLFWLAGPLDQNSNWRLIYWLLIPLGCHVHAFCVFVFAYLFSAPMVISSLRFLILIWTMWQKMCSEKVWKCCYWIYYSYCFLKFRFFSGINKIINLQSLSTLIQQRCSPIGFGLVFLA